MPGSEQKKTNGIRVFFFRTIVRNLRPNIQHMTASKKKNPSSVLKEQSVQYRVKAKKKDQSTIVENSHQIFKPGYIKRSIELMGMGGDSLFRNVENENDFIFCIRNGVPKKALNNLIKITGITNSELSAIIRTSDRTLRRYDPLRKLNAAQSERVIELAKLYSRGEEVFDNLESFKEWMNSTVMALGNKKPKEFLDTSLGIESLMEELGRIEQGIFA